MTRSIYGLEGAGKWQVLKKMLPDLKGKRVLDLGCGYPFSRVWAIPKDANKPIDGRYKDNRNREAR